MAETLWLALRAVLLGASFCGLCATARNSLKIDRFVAPFAVACGVIAALMFAGMLRLLQYGFWAVYLAGFAGLVYTYVIRRARPDFALIGLLAAFAALLTWRLYPCTLSYSDDISHWGLVARHMLRANAFPDAAMDTLRFSSYPPGSASFIYYISRTLSHHEGIWMIANNFLMGIFFLPVLSHIRSNRALSGTFVAAVFLALFGVINPVETLRVDWQLGFFCVGVTSALSWYREDLKRALFVGVPAMIAVVFFKSSGLFFAALTVLCLATIAARGERPRAAVWRVLLLGAACFLGAYLLWTLNVRLTFPAGLDSKHAVSISAYAERASSRGVDFMLLIARKMASMLLRPSITQIVGALFVLGCAAACLIVAKANPGLRRELPRALKGILSGVGVHAVWLVMVFFMYVFSMPTDEALALASFSRYNDTGLICMIGMAAVALVDFLGRGPLPKPFRALYWGALALLLAAAVVRPAAVSGQFRRTTVGYNRLRTRLIAAREALQADAGGKYMIYWNEGTGNHLDYSMYYHVKYEFDTPRISGIMRRREPDEAGAFEYLKVESAKADNDPSAGHAVGREYGDDPIDYIRGHIGEFDALIVVDEDAEFEAALNSFIAEYRGGTPILFAYRLPT